MKNTVDRMTYLRVGTVIILTLSAYGAAAQTNNPDPGEAAFKENCAACHADGGNILDPGKTLSKKDRQKHGIKTAADIIKIMRNPGERMMRFDEGTLSDVKAKRIAEYILKTFP